MLEYGNDQNSYPEGVSCQCFNFLQCIQDDWCLSEFFPEVMVFELALYKVGTWELGLVKSKFAATQ